MSDDYPPAEEGALRGYFDDLKQQGKKLVLSIDGGGTKGLITLCCLKELERLAGMPLYELFDFYAGTSTGSIIAAALARRMEIPGIIGLYKEFIPVVFERDRTINGWQLVIDLIHVLKPKLFGKDKKSIRRLAGHDLKYMYKHEELWGFLRDYLGTYDDGGVKKEFTFKNMYDWPMPDSENGSPKRLLITIKDTERSETLFAVNSGKGKAAFEDVPIAWAVLGSSVAPIYLESFGTWVDGGVGSYSNPCYVATVEATRYFTQPSEEDSEVERDGLQYRAGNIVHFSFGTGYVPTTKTEAPKGKEGDPYAKYLGDMHFVDWLKYVATEQQDDANEEEVLRTHDQFCRGPKDESVDFRRFQLVLDTELLQADIKDGGLGTGWLDELDPDPEIRKKELALIRNLHMASREQREKELMETIGRAWGRALACNDGEGFKGQQYPYEKNNPYFPPASPVLAKPPGVNIPQALEAWTEKIRPELDDYIEKKMEDVKAKGRYAILP